MIATDMTTNVSSGKNISEIIRSMRRMSIIVHMHTEEIIANRISTAINEGIAKIEELECKILDLETRINDMANKNE